MHAILSVHFVFKVINLSLQKDFMGIIDTKLAKKAIDQIDEMKVRGLTIASRGEPLLYNDLDYF